jgi:transcription elongation factor Elf1
MRGMKAEIRCPGCGRETLLLRKPKYDGLKKVGEDLTCSECGHRFESEEKVAFTPARKIAIFGDDDRSPEIKAFAEGEADRLCGHCRHYVVNPFRQWCGRHRRDVEATDTCGDFEPRPPESATGTAEDAGLRPPAKPSPPL